MDGKREIGRGTDDSEEGQFGLGHGEGPVDETVKLIWGGVRGSPMSAAAPSEVVRLHHPSRPDDAGYLRMRFIFREQPHP
jgi:hypothetical protein